MGCAGRAKISQGAHKAVNIEQLRKMTESELRSKADAALEDIETATLSDQTKGERVAQAQFYLAEIARRSQEQERIESEKIAQRDYKLEKWVIWLIGAEIVLAVTAMIVGWIEGNKQLEVLDKLNQSSAATATTLRIDQRAWLSPNIINQIFLEGRPLLVPVQFNNTGKTPAIHVQTCVVAEIVEKSRKDIDTSCPESSKSPGLSIVFPTGHIDRVPNASGQGGKTNIDPQGLLRAPLIKELKRGEKMVYVYGRVDYWDVFNKPHWSTFCSGMSIMPPIAGVSGDRISWVACQNKNDVDPVADSDQ